MSFAQALDRLNESVVSRLWDTQVEIGGRLVNCLWEQDYVVAGMGGMGMSTSRPAITLLSSDVPLQADGLSFVIRGKTYTVTEQQPDGQGLTTLLLEL